MMVFFNSLTMPDPFLLMHLTMHPFLGAMVVMAMAKCAG